MMHKTCSINYGHLADLQKTLPTTDLNKKKLSFDKISPRNFHYFPFFSICTCSRSDLCHHFHCICSSTQLCWSNVSHKSSSKFLASLFINQSFFAYWWYQIRFRRSGGIINGRYQYITQIQHHLLFHRAPSRMPHNKRGCRMPPWRTTSCSTQTLRRRSTRKCWTTAAFELTLPYYRERTPLKLEKRWIILKFFW